MQKIIEIAPSIVILLVITNLGILTLFTPLIVYYKFKFWRTRAGQESERLYFEDPIKKMYKQTDDEVRDTLSQVNKTRLNEFAKKMGIKDAYKQTTVDLIESMIKEKNRSLDEARKKDETGKKTNVEEEISEDIKTKNGIKVTKNSTKNSPTKKVATTKPKDVVTKGQKSV